MPKYGKVAVARVMEDEAGRKVLEIVKEDFAENRKALAVDWINDNLEPEETLQVVRLDTSYQTQEVVQRKMVAVAVEEDEEDVVPVTDADGLEDEEEDGDIEGTEGDSYAEKLANDEYDTENEEVAE